LRGLFGSILDGFQDLGELFEMAKLGGLILVMIRQTTSSWETMQQDVQLNVELSRDLIFHLRIHQSHIPNGGVNAGALPIRLFGTDTVHPCIKIFSLVSRLARPFGRHNHEKTD